MSNQWHRIVQSKQRLRRRLADLRIPTHIGQ